jgi:type II secretory pathway pseudopilin PulG
MKLRIRNRKARGVFAPRRKGDQKGQILIEVLVALAILGIVAVAFLTALTTTSVALIIADQKTTANSLTRSELEYIQNSEYRDDGNYDLIDVPTGYSLEVYVEPVEEGMQKVTVKVYQQDKLVLTTSDYKTER